MRNFVLKIEFSADDDNANAVLERIADAFNGIVDLEWHPKAILLVPDSETTDEDEQADTDFANDLIYRSNARLAKKTD